MKEQLNTWLEWVKSGQALLVDVREESEWEVARLQSATLAPLSELELGDFPQTLPANKPLLLYCRAGRRAMIAESLLKPQFPQATGMPVSFEELVEAGFEVEA